MNVDTENRFSSLSPAFRKLEVRLRRYPALSLMASLMHGTIAGGVTQLLLLPLDMIVTRMQAVIDETSNDQGTNLLKVVNEIYEEGGISHFWSSLGPGLLVHPYPALFILH